MENKIILTQDYFFQYSVQPLWIWYDLFGDISQKGDMPKVTARLLEERSLYKKSCKAFFGFAACVDETEPEKAAEKTLQLMREGAAYIYQGCIQIEHSGVVYRGRPDLLEKREGRSIFGDWHYAPVEIKASSSKIEGFYKYQLIFYSLLLEKIQGCLPEKIKTISAEGESVVLPFGKTSVSKTRDTIKNIVAILRGKKPEVYITSASKNSPWFDLAFKEAKEKKDISLIYKMNIRIVTGLRRVGINTLNDLAACNIYRLPKIPYAPIARLEQAKLQAQSLLANKAMVVVRGGVALSQAKLKLYFDIDGSVGVDYLFGIWVSGDEERRYAIGKNVRVYDNQDGKYFIYFIAQKPEEEKKIWSEFLDWIAQLPAAYTVYHYSYFEDVHLKKLAEKYGNTPFLEAFQSKLVNVRKLLENILVLPLYSYAVGDVAKSECVNFKWRREKVEGENWYKQWLESGDKEALRWIIDYNEDTAKATEQVLLFICDKMGGC